MPVVAVLGNHEYQSDQQAGISRTLAQSGIHVLEGTGIVLTLPGGTLGVAGSKGFGGGFPGRCASEFGEPEMKEFVRHSRQLADGLGAALRALHADALIALTHYAPVPDTLAGEPPEIHPFLGSYFLAEAADGGTSRPGHLTVTCATPVLECGLHPGGRAPVRNVALPVLHRAYAVYEVSQRAAVR